MAELLLCTWQKLRSIRWKLPLHKHDNRLSQLYGRVRVSQIAAEAIMVNFITVNQDNIDTEHICCIIADKKGETGASSKKAWLKDRFEEGLVFRKLDARGKVFIEYIPAEHAWVPLIADGYMFINCFWVSGQYKGQGHGSSLLEECMADAQAKGMKGLAVISSNKKRPFLSEPSFLRYKGFEVCDHAEPYYDLLYLPFGEGADKPRFKDCCRSGTIRSKEMVLYYTNQCPYTENYAPLLADIARSRGIDFTLIKIETRAMAQNAPSPFTTYSLFYEGKFLTNEILSESKFLSLLDKLKL
jgi:ribosomal protein S18 acetylase RimI-like enzyme